MQSKNFNGRLAMRRTNQEQIKPLCSAWLLTLIICCTAVSSSWASLAATPASHQLPSSNHTLEQWVLSAAEHLHPEIELAYPEYLGLLYRQARFSNFWIDSAGHPNAAAQKLLKDLQPWLALEEHPRLASYHQLARLLSMPLKQAPARHRQARDLVISDLFLRYQQDLLTLYWTEFDLNDDHGVINAHERWDNWPDEVVKSSLDKVFASWLKRLDELSASEWAKERLVATRPTETLYLPWRKAFSHLQAAAAEGPWPQLPQNLEPGAQGPDVSNLAVQLARLGDLATADPWLEPAIKPDASPSLAEFDKPLSQAVKAFQRRHNLTANGRVDSATRAALNTPPSERKRRLAHNLRRLYHLPRQLNSRHLMINLADQRMQFFDQQEVKLEMKVITGRDGQRTPIMSQWLTSLVLNPIWNVPPSIAQERIFPRVQSNPDYLAARDYALVQGWHTPARYVNLEDLPDDAFTDTNRNYRLVQKAGHYNQLGRAKFRLSNQKAIYLHDTPYRQEFGREQRALSAGCVRLEDSDRLVEALLARSKTWTPERVAAIYEQGEERYLQVRPRVAVYLMYWTAWTDHHGRLQWREDIYAKDSFSQPQRLALKKLSPSHHQ